MAPQDDPDIMYYCTACRTLLNPGPRCPIHGLKGVDMFEMPTTTSGGPAKTSSRETEKEDKTSRARDKRFSGNLARQESQQHSSSDASDFSDSDRGRKKEKKKMKKEKSHPEGEKRHQTEKDRRKVDKSPHESSDESIKDLENQLKKLKLRKELQQLQSSSIDSSSSGHDQKGSEESKVEDEDASAVAQKPAPPSTYSAAVKMARPPVDTLPQYPTLAQAASAPSLKPFVVPKCDAEHPNEWPQDQKAYNARKDGKIVHKWFPGTSCGTCGGGHPTEACGRFWECLTRKYDREPNSKVDDECTICVQGGFAKQAKNHKTESHGLMAPYDLPTNPLLSSLSDKRFEVYGRPWPAAAWPFVPFHPYAYHPKQLKDQKPTNYPDLHTHFDPLKWGLMLDNGEAAGQISAIRANKPYQSAKPIRKQERKAPKPPRESKTQPEAGSSGGPNTTAGWDGVNPDPKLPNPFWEADRSAFPSDGFFNCIRRCMNPDALEYCESLQSHSQQYATVLQAFPKLKEKKTLSDSRKLFNESAWRVLRPYAEKWHPGWTPARAAKQEFARQFEKMPKTNPEDVMALVKSQHKQDIEIALENASESKIRESASMHTEGKPVQDNASGSKVQAPQPKVMQRSKFPKGRQTDLSAEVYVDLPMGDDEPHHCSAHINAWQQSIHQHYDERENLVSHLDSTFQQLVVPGLRASGAPEETVVSAGDLFTEYLDHCEILITDLHLLAGQTISNDPYEALDELQSRAIAVFKSFDESIDGAIDQFLGVTDILAISRLNPAEMGVLWPELMGISLPGRLDMDTALPCLAWSEIVQSHIKRASQHSAGKKAVTAQEASAFMRSQHGSEAGNADNIDEYNDVDIDCP